MNYLTLTNSNYTLQYILQYTGITLNLRGTETLKNTNQFNSKFLFLWLLRKAQLNTNI